MAVSGSNIVLRSKACSVTEMLTFIRNAAVLAGGCAAWLIHELLMELQVEALALEMQYKSIAKPGPSK
jgi:hypothetical protein